AILLYGASHKSIISEDTFRWQWNNLLLPLEYDRLDMMMTYWKNAYDFATYYLPRPGNYFLDSSEKKSDIESELNEFRMNYIEFHYALGGLLLFRKEYELLREMIEYSTGNFKLGDELFNESIDVVIKLFVRIKNPERIQNVWINGRYTFPNIHAYNSNIKIKSYLYKFIALNFLIRYNEMGKQRRIRLINFLNLN